MAWKSVTGTLIIMVVMMTDSSVEAVKPDETPEVRARGRLVYERACLWCHGTDGLGDGPAGWDLGRFVAPRPRSFVSESYKFRSTPSGMLPTDQDLFRTITRGIPGVMPSFASLTERERWEVIAYIKSLNPAFRVDIPAPIAIPVPPIPPSDASIQRGRAVYREVGCQTCHGENGTGGKGPFGSGDLTDARGLAVSPTDLTARSSFKNGTDPLDIYRTLMTGLDGTPMPSYAHTFEGHEEDIWHLINYLRSLSAEALPQ